MHSVQLGSVQSSSFPLSAVGLRSLGFLVATEPDRCGLRGLLWLLWLLTFRSSVMVGRLLATTGLGGGSEGAVGGMLGGLCNDCNDCTLVAESALLMALLMALCTVEYPLSLRTSTLTAFSTGGDLSSPRSDGWERFAATLAAGDRRNDSRTGPWWWFSLSSEW